jgi:hypothetical protein
MLEKVFADQVNCARLAVLVTIGLNSWENLRFIHELDGLEKFLEEPDRHQTDDGTPQDRDDPESESRDCYG